MSKVVAVGPLPPPINGSSLSFLEATRGLEEARHCDLAVINLSSAVADRGGRPTILRAREYAKIIAKLVATLLARRPEVLYLHTASSVHGLGRDAVVVALAWVARVDRVVLHFQSGNVGALAERGPLTRFVMRAVYRRADALVTLADELRSMFDFDPRLADRVRVVPNCAPDSTTGSCRSKSLGSPVRVLFLSNLIESKGWLTLLRAVPAMRDSARRAGCELTASFAGQFLTNTDDVEVRSADHARAMFEQEIRKTSLEKVVRYHGVVDGDRKESLLREAHIFVLPTMYNKEAQPLSIAEAMASGAVIIASNYRGIPSQVADGESGVLVDEPTPASIAAAFDRLMDAETYGRMSKAAMVRYREKFSPAAYRERTREVVLGR